MIKELIESRYDNEQFLSYLKAIFQSFEPSLDEYEDPEIESEIKQIERYRYLGKLELDDGKELGFFEFEATSNVDIENNRVSLNAILKRKAQDLLLDGAIASFYHPKQDAWRLSFIKFDYDENDKRVPTNLKRFTFVLGEDIPTKTAYAQLKDLKNPTIVQLLEAFSVEKVSKEFYQGIIKNFQVLIEQYLTYPTNDENSRKEFSIKLIGRILFLKFLWKKDFVDKGIFDVQEDYYHMILEPLFFQKLNTPVNERLEEFKDNKVPFLNGSLFEAVKHIDFYEYDTDLKIRKRVGVVNDLNIDNKFFIEFFEHLDRYNFTVDENSLDDNDLSIDPEMLGRIFENLLAELNEDTANNARKASGSYYTPREIVDYMVENSIYEYLKSHTSVDEKCIRELITIKSCDLLPSSKLEILKALYELKILDPACGSGAFPMGLLQKILAILEFIDPNASIWYDLQNKDFKKQHESKNKNYIRKLSIIKNSIFGVDIQPIAVEISRLRFFLSLVVDEVVDENKPNRGIEPLPNLEFKFACANTLMPMPKDSILASTEYYKYLKELRALKNEYFESYGENKKSIRDKYKKKQQQLFDEIDALDMGEALENVLLNYDPFDPTSRADFFDVEFMFNLNKGFDIVIGNPPYLRVQGIDKTQSQIYKKLYKSATGSYDLYVLFVERGLELINTKGVLNFIMPHKWTNSAFGKGLREYVKEHMYKLISFDAYQVFNASTYTSLLWLKKEPQKKFFYQQLDRNLFNNSELQHYLQTLEIDDFAIILNQKLSKNAWILTDKQTYMILEILEKQPYKIKDIFSKIYQGIATSKDSVYFLKNCQVNGKYILGYSKELEKDVKIESSLLKPLLKGDDVHRYETLSTDKYVLFPYYISTKDVQERAILYSEEELKFKFPMGYDYLKECEEVLRDREKGRLKNDEYWYRYIYPKNLTLFNKEKLFQPDISLGGNFSYDKNGEFYATTTLYGYIKYPNIKESYKYFLALLNSKLLWWYLTKTGTTLANGFFRFKPDYLKSFPMPKIDDIKQTKPFEILVDYMFFLRNLEHSEQSFDNYVSNEHIINSFDEVIDAMVFELYFKNEFKSKNIEFISYAIQDYKSIDGLDERESKKVIWDSFNILKESNNKIRNNLILLDIEFKDLITPIKRSL